MAYIPTFKDIEIRLYLKNAAADMLCIDKDKDKLLLYIFI